MGRRIQRVCLVSNSVQGEYTGRFRWAREMGKRGYEVVMVLPGGERADLVEEMKGAGVEVVPWQFERRHKSVALARAACQLRQTLRAVSCDVIHSFGHAANLCTASAARGKGVPVLAHVTGMGSAFVGLRRWPVRTALMGLYRLMRPQVKLFVFQNADDAAAFSVAPARQKVVIPGTGVDTEEWQTGCVPAGELARVRQSLGIQADTPVAAYVGRMHRDKGVVELEQAWRILSRSHPGARLLVVGDEDRTHMQGSESMTERLRSLPGVLHVPWTKEIKTYLQLSTVVVIPSHREGLPRVGVEAMALGKPVVASDAIGCRDIVRHNGNGLLFAVGDANALARAVEQVLVVPEVAAAMGRAGRQRAVTEFSLQRIVDSVESLYPKPI